MKSTRSYGNTSLASVHPPPTVRLWHVDTWPLMPVTDLGGHIGRHVITGGKKEDQGNKAKGAPRGSVGGYSGHRVQICMWILLRIAAMILHNDSLCEHTPKGNPYWKACMPIVRNSRSSLASHPIQSGITIFCGRWPPEQTSPAADF